jgi:hypothetical protein
VRLFRRMSLCQDGGARRRGVHPTCRNERLRGGNERPERSSWGTRSQPPSKGFMQVSQQIRWCEWVVRDRIELSTFRFSGGRSYRLSYLTLAIQRKGSNRCGPDGI